MCTPISTSISTPISIYFHLFPLHNTSISIRRTTDDA